MQDLQPLEQRRVSAPAPGLSDVLITGELSCRPSRAPDYQTEGQALHALARHLVNRPQAMIATLLDKALELCRADTAGISLLETPPGEDAVFRWVALAGAYRGYEGGTTPAHFSPCGTCLERKAPQLYARPARYFTHLRRAEPEIFEALVIPLVAEGQPVGTICVVTHDDAGHFDAEDVRLMTSLADFTAAALRTCSARQAAEEARRREWAAHAIVGLTRDLTEERRRVEELAEADRNKDAFLAQLGHELRNSLAPLLNGQQVIRLGGDDRGVREEALEVAQRQLRQLQHITDDLLDLARVRQGKMDLKLQMIDLNAVVAAAVETAKPAIEERGQELEVSLPPGRVPMEADPSRLQQAVVNLLNNACKYTDAGGRIRMAVENAEGEAVVRVEDTGIGLAPEVLGRIFDLYAQAADGRRHSQGGLGIGLSLVKCVVELHGGSVTAQSDGPGRGSRFVVRLPVREATPSLDTPGPEAAPACARSLRVLLVDDNCDSTRSLAQWLRLWGHAVETAADGASALWVAGIFQPEVVLLDVGLPGMDGREVARRLRRVVGSEQALLVALTGFGEEEDHRLSREAGLDFHLVKPVDMDALQDLLARHGAGAARDRAGTPSFQGNGGE